MAREFFCAYHSYLEAIEPLTDEERGRLFTACLIFSKCGTSPTLDGAERYVFPSIRSQIQRDKAAYDKFSDQQRERARLRWAQPDIPEDAGACHRMPAHAGASHRMPPHAKEKEKEKEKEMEMEIKKEREETGASPNAPAPLSKEEEAVPMPPEVRERIEQMRRRLYRQTGVLIPPPPKGGNLQDQK